METADTICAISSPPGEGGIGIIRISGPKAHSLLLKIFEATQKRETYLPRTLYLGNIINRDNKEKIDEVFVVLLEAPKTYTREDMAEIYRSWRICNTTKHPLPVGPAWYTPGRTR